MASPRENTMSARRAISVLVATIVLLGGLWGVTFVSGIQSAPMLAANGNAGSGLSYLPVVSKNYPPLPYLLATIQLPAGSHPPGIDLDIAGRRAFVGNHQANTLSVLDTVSMTVIATIALPNADGPNGVAYHAGLDRVYVADRNTDNLAIVDPTSGAVIGNRAVDSQPNGVAVQGNRVYVANFGSDSVSILDAQANVVTKTLLVGDEPSLMAKNDEQGVV